MAAMVRVQLVAHYLEKGLHHVKISSEKVTIEESGSLDCASGADFDFTLSDKFIIPMIATASLPSAAGVEGMIVYDSTLNKLVVSNGTAWETVTSSA